MKLTNNVLYRKIAHVLIGMLLLFAVHIMYYSKGSDAVWIYGIAFTLFVGFLEAFRLALQVQIPLYSYFLKKQEYKQPSGFFIAILTATVVLYLFPFSLAFPVLAILVLGDAAASVAGRTLKTKQLSYNKNKTMGGSLSLFLIGILVLLTTGMDSHKAIVGAIVYAAIESLPIKVDDNFSAPFITTLVLTLL